MKDILFIIDDGHGMGTNGKRTPPFSDGTQIRENQFNRAVAKKIKKLALENDFDVFETAPGDDDVSLFKRSNGANKISRLYKKAVLVSIHFNAHKDEWDTSKAEGVETWYQKGAMEGKKLAASVHKYLREGTKQKDRGVKAANFHILRETTMPACLVECGFMDDPREASLMLDDDFQNEVALEILMGVCDYFSLKVKTQEKATFEDVPAGHWAYEDIEKLHRLGIVQGTSDKLFNPDRLATRAEVAVLISRAIDLLRKEV